MLKRLFQGASPVLKPRFLTPQANTDRLDHPQPIWLTKASRLWNQQDDVPLGNTKSRHVTTTLLGLNSPGRLESLHFQQTPRRRDAAGPQAMPGAAGAQSWGAWLVFLLTELTSQFRRFKGKYSPNPVNVSRIWKM